MNKSLCDSYFCAELLFNECRAPQGCTVGGLYWGLRFDVRARKSGAQTVMGMPLPKTFFIFFYLKWHDSVHLEWHCWQNICLQDVVTMTPRTLAGWQCKPPSCFVHSHTSFVQNRCANDSQLKISRKQTDYWLTWICNSGRWFASSAELPIIFHKPLRKWVTKVERD